MSVILNSSNNGTLGAQPRSVILRCRNSEASSAIAKYDLVRLDFSQSSIEPGQGDAALTAGSNSKFANVVLGPTGRSNTTTGIYGVAQEAIAAGASGNIMFAGVTPVTCASATYAANQIVGIPASGLAAGRVTNASVTQNVATVLVGGTTVTQITVLLEGGISFGANV